MSLADCIRVRMTPHSRHNPYRDRRSAHRRAQSVSRPSLIVDGPQAADGRMTWVQRLAASVESSLSKSSAAQNTTR